MNSTQYDSIAEAYRQGKTSPLRRHVEAFTFQNLLGDLQGLNVLDLACGDGFYTRWIKQAGAAKVIGVDISAAMIALAKQDEQSEPLDIAYVCADVATMPLLGSFDCVSAAYLLHYSPSVEQLNLMCHNVAAQLKPGGRFVSINENPDCPSDTEGAFTIYGFNKIAKAPVVDGSKISYSMISGRSVIRFDAFYYTRATYEAALSSAGFVDIVWSPLQLSPAGIEECGADYWSNYMSRPPVTGLSCRLPGVAN